MNLSVAQRALDAFAKLDAPSGWPRLRNVELIQGALYAIQANVYRFQCEGLSIIGKRSVLSAAQIERMVYEKVLPALACPSLKYYGYIEDHPGFAWIFVEDTGGQEYREPLEQHRNAAACSMAALHMAGTRLQVAGLPDRTPAWYLAQLRSGRARILASLGEASFTGLDIELLTTLVKRLDTIEAGWAELAKACEALPSTFIHCDLQSKNLHVRSDGMNVSVFPIDWEYSGWGSPVSDLTFLDISHYFTAVYDKWTLSREEFKRLARIGHLFHMMAGIEWASMSLPYEDGIEEMRHYVKIIPESLDEIPDRKRG